MVLRVLFLLGYNMNPLDEASKLAPGAAGSVIAVFLLRPTWPRSILLFLAGTLAAKYLSPLLRTYFTVDVEVGGFISGLFVMAILGKVFDTFATIDGNKIVERILTKLGF